MKGKKKYDLVIATRIIIYKFGIQIVFLTAFLTLIRSSNKIFEKVLNM